MNILIKIEIDIDIEIEEKNPIQGTLNLSTCADSNTYSNDSKTIPQVLVYTMSPILYHES